MKILVTGASGYIGNKLVHVLANQGNKIHAFIRPSSDDSLLQHPNSTVFRGDILDIESLENAMKGCEQVYHLAGIVKLWLKDRDMIYKTNVGGTISVLKTALKLNVRKMVYTSSCGVWSPGADHIFNENDPNILSFSNDYDLSKYLAEKAVIEYSHKGLFTVIVNPPRVYGPGQKRFSNAVNRFVSQLLSKKIFPMPWRMETSGNYAFVDDVVKGHIMAMEKGLGSERYILGGENISYKKLTEVIKKITGVKNIFLRTPSSLLKLWGWIELLRSNLSGHDPFITPKLVSRFCIDKMLDSSKAVKQLGYKMTPFEEGMRITIDHLKANKYVHFR